MASLPTARHVLDEYLDHTPAAQHAALHDPQYAAGVHRLRTILDRLGHALAAEGVTDEDMVRRVGARLVTDLLGTDEANARITARSKAVMELYNRGVVRIRVDDIPEALWS